MTTMKHASDLWAVAAKQAPSSFLAPTRLYRQPNFLPNWTKAPKPSIANLKVRAIPRRCQSNLPLVRAA